MQSSQNSIWNIVTHAVLADLVVGVIITAISYSKDKCFCEAGLSAILDLAGVHSFLISGQMALI